MAMGTHNETIVAETAQGVFTASESGWLAVLNTTCPTDNEREQTPRARLSSRRPIALGRIRPHLDPSVLLNGSNPSTFPGSLLAQRCVFLIDPVFVQSLPFVYLSRVLPGTLSTPNPDTSQNPAFDQFFGPQILQTIYNEGSVDMDRVTAIFQNISISLTNHMRMNPIGDNLALVEPSSSRYLPPSHPLLVPELGTSWEEKTYLQVQWAWFTVPAALVLFTSIFFIRVLYSTPGDQAMTRFAETWKSSPLPLLFHGLVIQDADDRDAGNQPFTDVDRMESRAKRLAVRLTEDPDGRSYFRARAIPSQGKEKSEAEALRKDDRNVYESC